MHHPIALEDGYRAIAGVSAYPAEVHPLEGDLRLMVVGHRSLDVPLGILHRLVLRYQEEILLGFPRLVAPFVRHYTLHGLDQHNVLAGGLHFWRHRAAGLHADEEDDHVSSTRSLTTRRVICLLRTLQNTLYKERFKTSGNANDVGASFLLLAPGTFTPVLACAWRLTEQWSNALKWHGTPNAYASEDKLPQRVSHWMERAHVPTWSMEVAHIGRLNGNARRFKFS